MLTYTEALAKILEATQTLDTEEVALKELLNRYLARPVSARFDLPRFDNSAVDGFGVKLSDVQCASAQAPAQLKLKTTIHAGTPGGTTLADGETIKILTGAPVPPSVDAVIMREFCIEQNGNVLVSTPAISGENIRRRGNEFQEGDEVLPAGMQANPAVIGLIASFGHSSYAVYRQPKIAIVVTGDELIEPGAILKDGQIYESNSYALFAAVQAMGLPQCSLFHAPDTREATRAVFERALEQADVIISAGGVSVGEHDFVKVALEEDLAVQTVFWRVAVKPGKPVYFGCRTEKENKRQQKLVFGLPGNPVSALVTFDLFVKPAIRKMQGCPYPQPEIWRARAQSDMKKKAGRMDFMRGRLHSSTDAVLEVSPTRGQDSHMLSGLAKANCLIHFPAESELIGKGDIIAIEPIDWQK